MNFQELVKGCIKNDRLCQKELYNQFYSYGLKTVMAYGNSIEDSREILNDTFVKTFDSLKNYDLTQPFLPWFRLILVRTIINHYHKNQNKIITTELSTEISNQYVADPDTLSHLEVEELLALTNKLPPAYKMVLNLYAIEGYSHEEIAKLLKINVGTSKSNLFKARTFLAKLIAKSKFYILF